MSWIRTKSQEAKHITSVCTGALLLAKLGMLRDQRATTHWAALDLLTEVDSTIQVVRSDRVVAATNGIVTSAGVSAGIDMAFDVVETICGKEVADETAHYIEYQRSKGVGDQ